MADGQSDLDTMPPDVRAVFAACPPPARALLLDVRALIFRTAASHTGVGPLTESLKWGEPSYASKAGTPVRLGWKPSTPDTVKLLVHCQTDLVPRWRELYGETFRFEGNRAILLDVKVPLPAGELAHCIAMALTYKLK